MTIPKETSVGYELLEASYFTSSVGGKRVTMNFVAIGNKIILRWLAVPKQIYCLVK